METIWTILQIVIGYNLVLPFVLFLLWSLKAKRKTTLPVIRQPLDYAIIITAYEQVHLIPSVLESIKQLNYSQYHVYVVADNCDTSKLTIRDSKVTLLRPETVLASNTKSHFYAINRFIREHDVITIIDSDNLVHKEYINEMNFLFDQGYCAVQGVRKPKELTSDIARLDAARDLYYDFYDSKVLFGLGSSSTLSGSGMGFRVSLFSDCLRDTHIDGAGFDKVLQAKILRRDIRIAYAPNAIVYDEKTAKSDQLVNQRSRWIYSWFKYWPLGRGLLLEGIKGGSVNQILFGIVLLRPPLFLFIICSSLCFIISCIVNPFHATVWMISFILFAASFVLALGHQNTDKKIYKSLLSIPRFIFYQIISLYYSRKASRRSIATRH